MSRSVPRNFNLTIRPDIFEILVAEEQYFPLSSIERELVKAFFAQGRYLNASDLSAKVRADVRDLGIGVQKVGLCRVGPCAGISEFLKQR